MSRKKPPIADWRGDHIRMQLDELSMMSKTLICLTPEPDDTEDMRTLKKQIREVLNYHIPTRIEQIRLALNPKSRRGCTGWPYIPSEEEDGAA